MDKKTAALIRAWLREEKRLFKGDQSEFSRGYRRALIFFGEVIRKVQDGETDISKL